MAMSAAERKRQQRERAKRAEKTAPDLAANFVRTPFFKAQASRLDDLSLYFDMMGIEMPDFSDDSGPRSLTGISERAAEAGEIDNPYPGYTEDSLGRAECMVDYLMDAASELASAINEYKLEQIAARIQEIEQADLSKPADKARALEDIVVLREIKARLEGKQFRRSFAEFRVKGSASS